MISSLNISSPIIKKEKVALIENPYVVEVTFENSENIALEEIDVSQPESIGRSEETKAEDEKAFLEESLKQEFKKGFEAGKNEAIKICKEEYKIKLNETVGILKNLINTIRQEFVEYQKIVDSEIIKLSLSIAQRVINREVRLDNQIVLSQVKEAVKKILGMESIIIHINPDDFDTVKDFKSELQNIYDSIKEINIQSNEKIERGSCRLESDLGNVDARFSTQIKIIEDALFEKLSENYEIINETLRES
jgi:flagellar assembly protein FliH